MKTNLKLKPNSNRSHTLRLQSQIVGATHRTDIFFRKSSTSAAAQRGVGRFGCSRYYYLFFLFTIGLATWQQQRQQQHAGLFMFESCQGPQRGNDAVAIYIWLRTAADQPIAAAQKSRA